MKTTWNNPRTADPEVWEVAFRQSILMMTPEDRLLCESIARRVAPWNFGMEPPDLSASHAQNRAILEAYSYLLVFRSLGFTEPKPIEPDQEP